MTRGVCQKKTLPDNPQDYQNPSRGRVGGWEGGGNCFREAIPCLNEAKRKIKELLLILTP